MEVSDLGTGIRPVESWNNQRKELIVLKQSKKKLGVALLLAAVLVSVCGCTRCMATGS